MGKCGVRSEWVWSKVGVGKCGVNIGVRSEFEGKIQFMTVRFMQPEKNRNWTGPNRKKPNRQLQFELFGNKKPLKTAHNWTGSQYVLIMRTFWAYFEEKRARIACSMAKTFCYTVMNRNCSKSKFRLTPPYFSGTSQNNYITILDHSRPTPEHPFPKRMFLHTHLRTSPAFISSS